MLAAVTMQLFSIYDLKKAWIQEYLKNVTVIE